MRSKARSKPRPVQNARARAFAGHRKLYASHPAPPKLREHRLRERPADAAPPSRRLDVELVNIAIENVMSIPVMADAEHAERGVHAIQSAHQKW